MKRLLATVGILVSVLTLTLTATQRAPGLAVYVLTETDPSGLQDAATLERQEAVMAVKKRLSSRKEVRLVGTLEEASIVIFVTSVSTEQVWMPTPLAEAKPLPPGEPLPEGTRPRTVARAALTRGSFSTSFAEAAGAFRASATGNLARSIDKWFEINAETLATLPGETQP